MDAYKNRVPVLQFPIRLDLGAGNYPRQEPDWIRMDADPCNGATHIIWDAKKGIPLPDGCVRELYTSHFLEHLAPVDLHFVLMECFRVCAHTAKAMIRVPHGNSAAGRLVCHYSFFTEETMQAIGDWLKEPGKPDYTGDCWDVQRIWTEPPYHLCAEYVILKGA